MQKLAEICVRRPVFATMLIMSLTVVGIFSYTRLGVERFPKIEFPTITVTTRLPGAAPEEIETEITDKIEEAVNTISNIDELRSISAEGISQVLVTFSLERDLDKAAQDVRDKVNMAIPQLPKNIDQPTVEKIDPDAAPIMTISVASNRTVREMTEYADKVVRRQLESVNGVGQVSIVGGRKRQINLQLDGNKLRAYNLTVTQVSQALQGQNLEVPGGRVEQEARTLTLRTLGRLQNVADFNNIVVSNRNGYPIKISDVGYTEDGVEDELSAGLLNDKPALLLQVRRQSGTNTVEVVHQIKNRIEELKKVLPPGYSLDVVRDQSTFIEASFHAIQEHLLLGSLLAAIVVLIFMRNLRATIIAAIAIPTSIISTFALMNFMGFSLNAMTMLALTLSVGIVIDDAIVVLENVFRYIEEKGFSPFQAAIEGTREIGLAVMATTLSLVVIFLPVAFMAGIVGKFMNSFGLTMAFAIMISLVVSFTLTPMLSSRMFKRMKKDEHHGEHASKNSFIFRWIDQGYTWLLKLSLKHRVAVTLVVFAVLFSVVPLFKAVGKNFIPYDDQDEYEVTLRAAEGTSLQVTRGIAARVAAEIRQLPGVDYTLLTIGDNPQHVSNLTSIYVRLVPIKQRNLSQFDLMAKTREQVLPRFKDLHLRTTVNAVQAIANNGQRNADIMLSMRGANLEKLTEYSQTLLNKLRQMPGVVDPDSSLIVGKPELRVHIDRAKAADLGVSISNAAESMRLLVGGDQVSTYNEGGEQYEVHVRATSGFRVDSAGIRQLNVPSSRLGSISLDNIVKLEESTGPTQIERVARQRQVLLMADLKPGGSQSEALEALNREVKALNMPPDYSTAPLGRSKELGRTMTGFVLAFVLSFVFMYMVLAAQFESFIHPITVMLALPLSLPFALISLVATGQTINLFTAVGILVLFGMVKKNSILQIDHTNGLRAKGMERHAALVQASRDRLRPILMTTIAFVAGMMPLAVSTGAGSGTNRSISVVVIGGQSLCLLLTLLVTPVSYSLFDDAINSRIWGRIGGSWAWARQKVATATSSFIGLFGK